MRAGTIYYLLIDKTIKASYLLMLSIAYKNTCDFWMGFVKLP
jgi:hypothetical protein